MKQLSPWSIFKANKTKPLSVDKGYWLINEIHTLSFLYLLYFKDKNILYFVFAN